MANLRDAGHVLPSGPMIGLHSAFRDRDHRRRPPWRLPSMIGGRLSPSGRMRTGSDLILGGDAGGPEGVAADPLGPARRGGPAFHHVEGVVTPAMPGEAPTCLGRGVGDGLLPRLTRTSR